MTDTNETTALSAPERRITLEAAAKKLGVTRRTIERILQMGEESGRAILTVYKGKPPGARQVTRMLDPLEVAQLKQEIKSGKFVISYPKKSAAVATRRVADPVATAPQLAVFNAISPDPWLNLKESAAYSRLEQTYLEECIVAGELPARNLRREPLHSWRIKRSALDALAPEAPLERANERANRAPAKERRSRDPWLRLGIISGD